MRFRSCPAYLLQAEMLIFHIEKAARQIGIEILHIHLADRDQDQIEIIRLMSYEEMGCFRSQLRDGDLHADLLVFGKVLEGNGQAKRKKSDYYGGQKPWQTQRG